MLFRRVIGFALAVLGLGSCDELPPEPCPAIGIVLEAPSLDSLRVGARVPLRAHPNLCMDPRAELEWEVSRPDVVLLAPAGPHAVTLLALAPGEGALTVWKKGTPPASGFRTRYRVVATPVPALQRDTAALFQTDALHYALRAEAAAWTGTVRVVLTNSRADTLSIHNCVGATAIALQKQVGDAWTTVWRPAIPACASPPIMVPPGAVHGRAERLYLEFSGSPHPMAFQAEDLPGIYRLVWEAVSGQAGRPPLEQRISNRFSLTVAGG